MKSNADLDKMMVKSSRLVNNQKNSIGYKIDNFH